MIDLRSANLVDFLPDSIAGDAEIVALSLAINPELRAVGAAIVEATILPRIAELSEPVLDALAWGFRLNELQLWVDATGATSVIEAKRAMLAGWFATAKKSGTVYAVRKIFDLIGATGDVIEWFEESAAPPYTYRMRVDVTEDGITLAQLTQIPELLHRFAPARCQMSELGVETNRRAPLLLYPATTIGIHMTIPFGGP